MRFAYKKTLIVAILMCIFTVFFLCCNNDGKKTVTAIDVKNNYGQRFAGSDKCAPCHKAIVDSFFKTAHFSTSAAANEQTVKGSFANGKNVFAFNYYEKVWLTKMDSGFYQIAIHRNVAGEAHRFDIVIGSGTRGQSYLSWTGNQLYQLPVSYFSPLDSWSNSPGYSDYYARFSRVITPRCLECHSTFAKAINFENIGSNSFDKSQIIYGVSCESCHGPASAHVSFHEQHPAEKKGAFIINTARLSKSQQLDQCGLCHSGLQQNIKPSFSFTTGDTLSKYFKLDNNPDHPVNLDVHGNKYALLSASKCFIGSPDMTCGTCHNTHNNERGNIASFSQKCVTCHDDIHTKFCTVKNTSGVNLKENCIDCHMPEKSSVSLTLRLQNETNVTPAVLRTHKIAVYAEETEKILVYMRKIKQRQ